MRVLFAAPRAAGLFAVLAAAVSCATALPAVAQDTIKIGEMNSYKSQPAFLEPYKRGWEMAVEDINASGGVLGKKLEVISRDDGANPGDAVRAADELVTGEGVNLICGTFLSNVGLAVTDKMVWQNGNRYTFPLRASTYMQVAMLMPSALAANKKRWALVYPNFEFGQASAAAFKQLIKAKQPDVEFVTEQATPLGKIDAGAVAQAIDDAKPDAIFSAEFGPDLAQFVREGNTRGVFKDRSVVALLAGEPEYLDPLKDDAPVGWIATGYPASATVPPQNPEFVAAYQKRYNEVPKLGAVVGYLTIKAMAAGITKAGSTDTEKVVDAFQGLQLTGPFGPFQFRAIDHQSTLGGYVGKIALQDG